MRGKNLAQVCSEQNITVCEEKRKCIKSYKIPVVLLYLQQHHLILLSQCCSGHIIVNVVRGQSLQLTSHIICIVKAQQLRENIWKNTQIF